MNLLTSKVKITDVVEGQYILSRNIEKNLDEYNKVSRVYRPTVSAENQLGILLENGTFVETSLNHPTLVFRENQWQYVLGRELIVSDICYTNKGESEIVELRKLNIDENFADFEVDVTNNYYAGAEPDKMMVVHNSSTVYAPVWHYEIEDILVLKNNKGTHETRVRRLDYSIQWDKFLLRKAVKNEDMALFSPHDVPDLYEAFFKKDRTEFETLYTKYAADKKIRKKVVKAREVLISFLKESQETGRVYLMFADNTNQQSPFKLPIYMSNLCSEISLPTKPIRNKVIQTDSTSGTVEFEGLVQLCTLGAVNLGNIDLDNTDDMQQRMYILVNLLNEVLDYQDYMLPQARRASMLHRPLGIGVINYAYFLAKNKLKYNDQESHDLTHRLAEQMYYYALRASVDLAAERGTALPGIDDTIYSEGKTLLDVYCKEVDSITNEPLHLDWDSLKADLAKFGVYNSTLLALMPSESSSTVSNATNGVEPIRAINTTKFNKKNTFVIVAPDANKVKYDFLWEMTPEHFEGYIRNMAVFQKFVCQAISTNLSYNPKFFPDEKISISVLLKDMILLAKYGLKTRYYVNTAGLETKDSNLPDGVAEEGDGCESGACKI